MSITWFDGMVYAENGMAAHFADPGLLVGDGLFETLAVYNNLPFALDLHLERLEKSARACGFSGFDISEVRRAINSVLANASLSKTGIGRLRVTVWRSAEEFGASTEDSSYRFSVSLGEVSAPNLGAPNDSRARLITSTFKRNEFSAISGHKSTSYAENAYALRVAQSLGATEAAFFNTSDELSEGSMTNIVVAIDGELLTPPLSAGCLPGVTRSLALEWGAAAGLPIREASRGELTRACVGQPAALLGTLRNVQIVSAWDGILLAESPTLGALVGVFAEFSKEFHASNMR